eukprot:TRINITY_DN6749_c0_g1_i12.p1 TRINITY_DN6749_c0_g1~~TRINITY_DN6749_c0_g1_i12.p1  ORF type:complete len:293 (-),score=37.68 TRINITY_DN6749_c0_g1_i12:5-883(-)
MSAGGMLNTCKSNAVFYSFVVYFLFVSTRQSSSQIAASNITNTISQICNKFLIKMEKQENSEWQITDLGSSNSVNNEVEDKDYILDDVHWELEHGVLQQVFGKMKEYEQRNKELQNQNSTIDEAQVSKDVFDKMKDYELRIQDSENSSSTDTEKREKLQVLKDRMEDCKQRIMDLEFSQSKSNGKKREVQVLKKIFRKMEEYEQRIVDLENLISADKEKKKEGRASEDTLNNINDQEQRNLDLEKSVFTNNENNEINQEMKNILNKMKYWEEQIKENVGSQFATSSQVCLTR